MAVKDRRLRNEEVAGKGEENGGGMIVLAWEG